MIMTKEKLITLLEITLDAVRRGDSAEGSLQYSSFNAPEGVEVPDGSFEVGAAVRRGTSQGQGSMLIIDPSRAA